MRLNKSHYLALEDAIFDSRIPLRSEDEFRVGINFKVKLVGCGNVLRPNTRLEIVAAMRKIRTECRTRKEKKRKVIITVSFEGVKVSLTSSKKSKSNLLISHHPIHRIFYVSHDSIDLHVFSFIAREGNAFRCFVFKANKQSLAVNVVRTIGQAFELCHKMTIVVNETSKTEEAESATTPTETVTTISAKDEKVAKLKRELDIEQILQDVDSKLDKLSDKVDILEKQITILLSNMELKNSDHSLTNSEQETDQKSYTSKLLADLKKTQLSQDHKLMANGKMCLNSPDSLLSSPIYESNHNHHPYSSCLLFNDIFR